MAMKSQFQTLSFLSNYIPKSDLDKEFINSFMVQRFQITPKTPVFSPIPSSNLIDVQSFISWFENGAEALKIARHKDQTVILGTCILTCCEIIGTLLSDNSIKTETITVDSQEVEDATEEQILEFKKALVENCLQPAPNELRLVPKHIPTSTERVVFYDFALDIQGVGVVREITESGDVVFFCYFVYPSPTQSKQIGYSMHENPGFNIANMVFESIDKENTTTTIGNSTSCFRRLGRELEKVGKVWKDKLKEQRIEPLQVEVKKGEKYFYISDKMEVRHDTEKGTPTSHLRYLSGNYFTTHMAATKMLGKFNELLRDYLASENWPELD